MNYTMKPLKLTPVVPLGRISKSKPKRPSFNQRKTKPVCPRDSSLLQPQPRRTPGKDPKSKFPTPLAPTSLPAPSPSLTQNHEVIQPQPSSTSKPKSNPKPKPKPKPKLKLKPKPKPPRQRQSRLAPPNVKVRVPTRPGSLQADFYGAVPGQPAKRQTKKRQKGRKASGSGSGSGAGSGSGRTKVQAPAPVLDSGDRKGGDKAERKKVFHVEGYVFGESLGKGTFGKVDKAEHKMTGVPVAMKILEKSRITDIADVNRVTREIRILKRVRHENVVRLFNVIDTLDHICLVTEFLDGGELFDYIVDKKRIPEPEACDLFLQTINGLDYIHSNNIIHRDLKPENLLLKRGPGDKLIVKLADFGLSNTNEGGRKLSTACGSPCYASPEMIRGKKYDGTKSDIWSIGVVLYAMVCGYLPFEDDDTSLLYDKILSATYDVPRCLSQPVTNLIATILTVDPDKRCDTKAIRKHRWCLTYKGETNFEAQPNDKESAPNETIVFKLGEHGVDQAKLRESLSSQKHDANTAAYYLMLSKHAATSEENPSQATASSSITSDNENSQALEESPRSEVPQLFPGVLIKHLDKTQKEDPTALARGVMEDKRQPNPEVSQPSDTAVTDNVPAA